MELSGGFSSKSFLIRVWGTAELTLVEFLRLMRSPSLERDIWSEKNNLASSSDRAAQSIITTFSMRHSAMCYLP